MKSARGTAALPAVSVKLPSDRCLSCKPTVVAGNLAGALLADIHKAVFVVLVKGAIKYKGEGLILAKEPKNESVWKANYSRFSICGLSSSGRGHVGRMNKQSLLLRLVLSIWRKNCFRGLAAWSLKSLSTFSTEQKQSYSKPIFSPQPPSAARLMLAGTFCHIVLLGAFGN